MYSSIYDDVIRGISSVMSYKPVIYLISEEKDTARYILERGACFDICEGVNVHENAPAASFRFDAQPNAREYYWAYIHDDSGDRAEKFIKVLENRPECFGKKHLFIVTPNPKIKPECGEFVYIIDVPMIGMYEFAELVVSEHNSAIAALGLEPITLADYLKAPDKYLARFKGLARAQVKSILRQVVLEHGRATNFGLPEKIARSVKDGELDASIEELANVEKEQLVSRDGTISFISVDNDKARPGGLAGLTRWVEQKRVIFKEPDAARERDVPFPKGILIAGLPGSGKSLTARYTAKCLQLPLVQFNLGRVLGGYVGDSEHNLERVLKLIEAVAPCVVWIDEIEKELSGAQGKQDTGVSSRLLGRLLNWMQENDKRRCFICATANQLGALPSELMRRGRFDAKFYTFLPMYDECVDIFVNLMLVNIEKKPGLYARDIRARLKQLGETLFDEIAEMEGKYCVGSDIEGIIEDAKFSLFLKNAPAPYDYKALLDALVAAARRSKPYGETNFEDVLSYWEALRKNPFENAALPEDCKDKYDHMLIDFSDLIVANGKRTLRSGLECKTGHEYDKRLFKRLSQGILNYKS